MGKANCANFYFWQSSAKSQVHAKLCNPDPWQLHSQGRSIDRNARRSAIKTNYTININMPQIVNLNWRALKFIPRSYF